MDPRHVALVIYPEFQSLDLVGPLEVFDAARRVAAGRRSRARSYGISVVAKRRQPIRSSSGLGYLPDASFDALQGPIDTLIVVGGPGSRAASHDREMADWVRGIAPRCRRVASVCTGTFVLGAAGLIDRRRVTTHWASADELERRFPRTTVERDPIFERDGRLWTSAGVTAGMDLSLAMVEDDLGRDIALEVARYLVVFVRRPGGQAQFSVQLRSQSAERQTLRDLVSWILEHLCDDLAVPALARRAAMSPRNFARVFARELGTTPAAFVEQARLELAQRLLETTDLSIEQVSRRAGFGTASTLRRAFARRVGIHPKDYRQRFQPALGRRPAMPRLRAAD